MRYIELNYRVVVEECLSHVAESAAAALAGDEAARAWMLATFPAYLDVFIQAWPENYSPSPPEPAIIKTLMDNAVGESSRNIVRKIATRGRVQ